MAASYLSEEGGSLVPVQNKKQYVGICTACVYPNGYLHKEVRMNTFQEIPVLFHEKYWQTSLEEVLQFTCKAEFHCKGQENRERISCLPQCYTLASYIHHEIRSSLYHTPFSDEDTCAREVGLTTVTEGAEYHSLDIATILHPI
jgi:hypothetical protein